jgi:proteasome accessory factor A
MSEYTTLLKMSTTAIVLEMIETNFITKDFSLKEPIRALQEISQYPDSSVPLTLSDGRTMTALQIQREYLNLAQTYFSLHEADEETRDILAKWEHVLECLETDPMRLRREIDWVIKRYWFGQYLQRRGLEAATDKILMLDLQYHDIHVKRGLYYLLERQGNVQRIVSDEEVTGATLRPPHNTRAKLRGELIKLAKEQKIHWNYIRFGHLMNFWVRFNDPFQTESEKVSLLKQRLQRSQFSPGVILWELSGNKD